MSTEEWRPVVGRTGRFSVSSLGQVRREASVIRLAPHLGGHAHLPQRLLTLRRKAEGYFTCDLWTGGRVVTEYVHRLVAAAFIGPCPPGHQVNHLDCDKANNVPENLEYVTADRNKAHAVAHGRHAYGEGHGRARLTENDVRAIRRANITIPGTMDRLAQRLGVSPVTIGKVHRRETWKHVK